MHVLLAASLFPWLAMLLTVVVVEFGLFYQQQSITSAVAAALHILWWGAA